MSHKSLYSAVVRIVAVLVTVSVLAYCVAWQLNPANRSDYDPIAVMTSDTALSLRRDYGYSREFQHLVEDFQRFKPIVRKWALGNPRLDNHEIAISAATANGLAGVDFLFEIVRDATPEQRAHVVRGIGKRLHSATDWREPTKDKLKVIEKENTVAGYYAYLGLAISDHNYAAGYSKRDRERRFRERGLDPYRDSDEVSIEWRPVEE